jgi:hypothetical protein
MRKTSLVVASVVLVISCIFGLPPADAQKPGGTPPTLVPPNPQTTPENPTLFCTFSVEVLASGKVSQITLPGGGFIITAPGLDVTLTNVTDPSKSVTFNVTGVFHQSRDPNGNTVTVATGRNLLADPFAGFVLAIGSFSFTSAANGDIVVPLAGIGGQLIKICPLIS